MDLMVLDEKFQAIAVVDAFKSAIWTVRYNSVGDFELYLPATKKNLDIFKENRYLWRRDSDRLMIIDSFTIENDSDTLMLNVSGESLESILKRRVVAGHTRLNGNLQDAVRTVIYNNLIATLPFRIISNFSFKPSTNSKITKLTVKDLYFQGQTVYEVVESICVDKNIGFRILPVGEGGFEFELYVGEDRSYDQNINPYVVFSPKFENLLGSRYVKTLTNYRNACCCVGVWRKDVDVPSSDGAAQTVRSEEDVATWAFRGDKEPVGLNRREMFLDNGTLDANLDVSTGDQAYWESVATEKGKEELSKYETTTAIDGELHGQWQWQYGEDYFLGDKVQVVNEFGMEATSYISEIVFSADDTGERTIPTFTSTNKDENNIL